MSELNGSGDNSTAEGPQATASFLDAPIPAPEPSRFSSIDDYAATLPAPDYVDPAGKASANAEAA